MNAASATEENTDNGGDEVPVEEENPVEEADGGENGDEAVFE